MMLQIAPLTSSILSLAWLGEPGLTYTIQTSSDFATWQTVPYVVEGNGMPEDYFLELTESRLFVRLQFDNDGDTDNNALPDSWEWQYFGYIGADADSDSDQDGASNYQEWLKQTHPLDFYNGEWPVIHVSCGRQWLVPAGGISTNGVSLYLHKPSGEPWSHAPVQLALESGNAGIALVTSNASNFCPELLVWTDSMGRIDPTIESIHVLASEIAGTSDALTIRAGQSNEEIIVHSIGGSFGPPPRNLSKYTDNEGNRVYSWTGDPGDADSFLLEEKGVSGEWVRIIELATSELSPADPVHGSYLLTIVD